MLKSIFSVFSIFFLLINMMLVFKTKNKLSFMKSFILCFVTELCIIALGAQVISLLNIRIGIYSMGSVCLLVGISLVLWNSYCGKIQTFRLVKTEVYGVGSVIVCFLGIFLSVFTSDLNLIYTNIDPAIHFGLAMNVIEQGKISSMYFGELYNALFIETLMPFVVEINYYKIFILSDTVANLINVLMFYCLADEFATTKFSKSIMPIVSMLYFMGWPFYNYVIGGFVYYGWGITLATYIVFWLLKIDSKSEKMEQRVIWILVLLGSFTLLRCYILFIPIIVALIIFVMWKLLKQKNVISFRIVGILVGGTCCVGMMIFCVLYLGYFKGDILHLFESLKSDGGIHRELFKDFIFLIPWVLYIFFIRKKEKKVNEVYVVIGIIGLYLMLTFICCYVGIMSPYYYYKPYFLLWIFMWVACVDAIDYLITRDKLIVYTFGGVVLFLSMITLLGVENSEELKQKRIIPNELTGHNNHAMFSIYGQTESFMRVEDEKEDRGALIEICEFINKQYDREKEKIKFISTSYYLGEWFKNFTDSVWVRVESIEEINTILKGKHKYIVIHKNSELMRSCDEVLNEFEEIYNNGYYGMYKLN